MSSKYIRYRGGYKYQLVEEYTCKIDVFPDRDTPADDYVELKTDGSLLIKKGYAWDGPSGPTIDTLNFMRGSLVHDALYQLMRNGHLDREKWREKADDILRDMCRADGMSRLRAWWVHRALRLAGDPAASPESRKKIYQAPV